MKSDETDADVYVLYSKPTGPGQVAVYRLEDVDRPASFPHVRRDFYKIELLSQAKGVLGYANTRVAVEDPALIFVNPLIPYSWLRTAGREAGFACLFTEEFITPPLRTGPAAESPLFAVGVDPVAFPTPEEVTRLTELFEQLLTEMRSTYINKVDLMRNYVQIIIRESLKMVPSTPTSQPGTSAVRLSSLFLTLLDGQFPITSPQHTLPLKNANEFARQLTVHTNHLNKALKEVTGKTTTEHVAEKTVAEAKALLHHSDWSVAEVGYCLGFEHATNFSGFFKKHTGQSPGSYRKSVVVSLIPD